MTNRAAIQQGLDDRRQEYEEGKRALPEPQLVKRDILMLRNDTREARNRLKLNPDKRRFRDLREKVLKYYDSVRTYITALGPEKASNYEDLKELSDMDIILNGDIKTWLEWSYKLDDLLYDLGVTDIGVQTKTYNYGLEIFNGGVIRPHVTKKIRRWMNWHKLKANFTALRHHLIQQDMDGFVLIWGANRAGKSTLAIHLMDLVNSGKISARNFVNTDENFYEATEELNEGQSYLVDELTNIFDIHGTRRKEQNKRIKKLETYAKRNMLGFGCTVNFFRVDKNIYSKLAAAIKITSRGNFNFYSPNQIEDFERDRQMKVVKTPAPEFRGRFPKRNDKIWKTYKEAIEDDKIFKKQKEEKRRKEDDKPSKKDLIQVDLEERKEVGDPINNKYFKKLAQKYDTATRYVRQIATDMSDIHISSKKNEDE